MNGGKEVGKKAQKQLAERMNISLQVVVGLYLHDKKASYLVLGPALFDILLTAWKLSLVLKIHLKWWHFLPFPSLGKISPQDLTTMEMDLKILYYFSFVLVPLIIGYAWYSFHYSPQETLYSWIISSLASAAYTFGFAPSPLFAIACCFI